MSDKNKRKPQKQKVFYYLVKEKGRVTLSSSKRERKKMIDARQKRYDRSYLYHLFCMSGGKVSEMWKYLQQLPPEQQKDFPCNKTLYLIHKDESWASRYTEFQAMLKTRMEGEDAMTYERMNKSAGYVLSLFLLRMAGLATKFSAPNADKSKIPISSKDLKYLWEMMRTEKGLPQNITKTNIHDSREDGIDDTIAKESGQEFLDVLNDLDGGKVADLIGGVNTGDVPEFLK